MNRVELTATPEMHGILIDGVRHVMRASDNPLDVLPGFMMAADGYSGSPLIVAVWRGFRSFRGDDADALTATERALSESFVDRRRAELGLAKRRAPIVSCADRADQHELIARRERGEPISRVRNGPRPPAQFGEFLVLLADRIGMHHVAKNVARLLLTAPTAYSPPPFTRGELKRGGISDLEVEESLRRIDLRIAAARRRIEPRVIAAARELR